MSFLLFLSTPGAGYVIAGIFCIGMIIGAIVKFFGWNVKDITLWIVVTAVYLAGIQGVLVRAGTHGLGSMAITLFSVGFLYWGGLGVGVWIVRRERDKSAKVLEAWLECYDEVVNGNGSNGC